MPRISVMIPAYDAESFIGPAIESVLCQDFKDYEICVIDDASQDRTAEVVKSYLDDNRVEYVRNEHNLGLTRNWNRCLQLSTGSLVQILQADDLIDSDYLSIVTGIFDTMPSAGFVAATCRHIDSHGQVTNPGVARSSGLYKAGDQAVATFLTGGFPHVSSIVLKRECYEQVGGFDEEFWFAPDVEMGPRLGLHFDYYRLGGVHTSFRRHGTNSGLLEFLRRDYVLTFMKMQNLSWSYLSSEARAEMGIQDLGQHIARTTASLVANGVLVMLAFGRKDLARYYFNQALELDPRIRHKGRFWKMLGLLALPLSEYLVRWRLKITKEDLAKVRSVEEKLRSRQLLLEAD
jgi:glycosyltransferase involved in cell wall biosynthesis